MMNDAAGQDDLNQANDPRKRKREGCPPIKKRLQYVAQACERCRDRKVRCDGARPCGKCQKESYPCRYPKNEPSTLQSDSVGTLLASVNPEDLPPETLRSTLQSIQRQLSMLTAKVDRQDFWAILDSGRRMADIPFNMTRTPLRSFPRSGNCRILSLEASFTTGNSGPTSSFYSFGMAVAILKGVIKSEQLALGDLEPASLCGLGAPILLPWKSKRNLDDIRYPRIEQMVELIRIFEEVFISLYPIFESGYLLELTGRISLGISGYADRSTTNPNPEFADDCTLIKLVCSLALLAEGAGESRMAVHVFESAQQHIDKIITDAETSLSGVTLLILVATYYFFSDDIKLGSRTIGVAARRALEAGFLKMGVLAKMTSDVKERQRMVRVVWTIFVLDRQYNFAAGFPHHLPDLVELPDPQGAPHLKACVDYVRMSEQACMRVWPSGQTKMILDYETLDFLEYRLARWQQELPEELQFDSTTIGSNIVDTGTYSASALLYLRACHVRVLVLRPLLWSPTLAASNASMVDRLIHLANDMIRVVSELDLKTEILKLRQQAYIIFLSSALAVLFLVLAGRSKNAHIGYDSVKQDLDLGLNVVRRLASWSVTAMRLSKTYEPTVTALFQAGVLAQGEPTVDDVPGSHWVPSKTAESVPASEPAVSTLFQMPNAPGVGSQIFERPTGNDIPLEASEIPSWAPQEMGEYNSFDWNDIMPAQNYPTQYETSGTW